MECNKEIYGSWKDEFVADIMNKLSPIAFHIREGFNENIPLHIRKENVDIANDAFEYIVHKLNQFRRNDDEM